MQTGAIGQPEGQAENTGAVRTSAGRGKQDNRGRRQAVAGSIVSARLAWEAITKGRLRFPDDDEDTVLSFDQWLVLMKFVYGQTEGRATRMRWRYAGRTAGRLPFALVDYRANITDSDE